MTDMMTKEQRRKNMQAIKSISKLESIVSKELWKNGFRFRRNSKELFGKPDISIKKYRVVIFIDSCFWHQCPFHGNMPKSNTDYWSKKLGRNIERDKEVDEYYKKNNWNIKRIWEHEVKDDLERIVEEVAEFIKDAQNK
ncbi:MULTISPECIES: very short patch repair endonuclease [Bacillus cereus group]|uniref:very short patch repair endonuclease n=1 Tax=Bacillus cereus group TaxID=86661 RepID=UPI0009B71565|nr:MULTISPECIES: very short patch repair endonuclease [Bacillus cereus group]ARC27605.1 very short patch repair endonuclease [Bacillus sp. FDAARGOS_235]PEI56808.1 very short patch repair endonuclease [Bacillus toyonensis]